MPVPKRKLSRQRTHQRRSANMKIEAPAHSVCPNCGSSKVPHIVCGNCGWYRGRVAIEVD